MYELPQEEERQDHANLRGASDPLTMAEGMRTIMSLPGLMFCDPIEKTSGPGGLQTP